MLCSRHSWAAALALHLAMVHGHEWATVTDEVAHLLFTTCWVEFKAHFLAMAIHNVLHDFFREIRERPGSATGPFQAPIANILLLSTRLAEIRVTTQDENYALERESKIFQFIAPGRT